MSKELTPLQAFEEIMRFFNIVCTTGDMDRMNNLAKEVRATLKDYESRKVFLDNVDNDVVVFEPKEVWEEKQKKLKALEFIKNHPNPILLMAVIEKYIMELKSTWEEYDVVFKNEPIEDREIKNKEDYDLLSEVFGNE